MNKIKMIGMAATAVSLIAQGISSWVDRKDMVETITAQVKTQVVKELSSKS